MTIEGRFFILSIYMMLIIILIVVKCLTCEIKKPAWNIWLNLQLYMLLRAAVYLNCSKGQSKFCVTYWQKVQIFTFIIDPYF